MTKASELAARLLAYRRVLLISHVDPDGDTIGSALGLAWALRRLGRDVRLTCQDPVPVEAAFLPGADAYRHTGVEDEEVVVGVDASDPRRLGSVYDAAAVAGRPLFVIDHHVTNRGFGDLNLIEHTASTAEIILGLVDVLGVPLDATIATCLLTGVVSDTQGFRTSNTTPQSLAAAQRLIGAGANLVTVADELFNHRSLPVLALWGRVLAAAELREGVIHGSLTVASLAEVNGTPQMGSGLVNQLNSAREARVAVLFTEQTDGIIDVSMRAKPGVDLSGVAVAFGGGGHAQAAGAQVPGDLATVREAVVAALVRLVADAA